MAYSNTVREAGEKSGPVRNEARIAEFPAGSVSRARLVAGNLRPAIRRRIERFMSSAEQNFLMNQLASMKDAGRIEVIRERGANFHVFAFLDGQRPGDDLISASLEDAGAPTAEEKEALLEAAKVKPRRVKTQRKISRRR